MSDLFKGQKLLTIRLDCVTDISSATVMKILYKKPDGTFGEWIATRDGVTNKIQYSVSNGEIDQAGEWVFQSYVEIGTLPGYGSKVSQRFLTVLKS
jgi:hypothetical protein